MGVLIGSAVAPSFATVVWKKLNGTAAVAAILLGFASAVTTWLAVTASRNDGVITVDTTGQDIPLLAGNVVALLVGALVTVVGSLISPQDCDWEEVDNRISGRVDPDLEMTEEEFQKYSKLSITAGLVLTFLLVLIWPIPMYATDYVFSKGFFTFWIVLCCIWATVAAITIIFLPLWDAFNLYRNFASGENSDKKEADKAERTGLEDTQKSGSQYNADVEMNKV
jgi:uncharacterized membrane protein